MRCCLLGQGPGQGARSRAGRHRKTSGTKRAQNESPRSVAARPPSGVPYSVSRALPAPRRVLNAAGLRHRCRSQPGPVEIVPAAGQAPAPIGLILVEDNVEGEAAAPAPVVGGAPRANVGAFSEDAPVAPVLLYGWVPDVQSTSAAESPRSQPWGQEVVGVPNDSPWPGPFPVGKTIQAGVSDPWGALWYSRREDSKRPRCLHGANRCENRISRNQKDRGVLSCSCCRASILAYQRHPNWRWRRPLRRRTGLSSRRDDGQTG